MRVPSGEIYLHVVKAAEKGSSQWCYYRDEVQVSCNLLDFAKGEGLLFSGIVDQGPRFESLLCGQAVVFVTGRGGAGFHFVTPPLLRPGVNSLPFLPAPYDTGPWPGCGAGRVFYFPR